MTESEIREDASKGKKKYSVLVPWQGYSMGESVWIVEADSEVEAKEYYWEGEEVSRNTHRDDTEVMDKGLIKVERKH